MPNFDEKAVELFKQKAGPAAITVVERKGVQEAMEYALEVCEKKDFCELLLSGCEQKLSDKAAQQCERAVTKVFAAPNIDEKQYSTLCKAGEKKGFTIIKDGMRNYLAGIDVGFVTAEMGIVETLTCVVESEKEDTRLATMVCEINVIALPKSKIVNTAYDGEEFLHKLMSSGPMYTAFISGPSRTADIERVLAIGVHGPLELHVVLLEE